MLIKKPDDIRPSEITPESTFKQRRRLLKAAGAAGVGLVTGGALFGAARMRDEPDAAAAGDSFTDPSKAVRLADVKPGPFSTDEAPNSYHDITSYNNFYELGTGKGDPKKNAAMLITRPWSVTVSGECDRPGVYDLEDFLAPHPLQERIYRLRCVEAWSMVIPWVGFPLGDALKRFGPNSNARYVEFETLVDKEHLVGQRRRVIDWPYREGLRMDEAMHPLTLLAVGLYGRELPNQNGAPLRLVVPWKYGFKSIKSIVAIRFSREQPVNTWNALQPNEYGFYANVNPAVDHPRWDQSRERRIGEWGKRPTLPFNGYADQVASLYSGMDLRKFY